MTQTAQLAVVKDNMVHRSGVGATMVHSFDEAMRVGQVFAESGLFKDVRSVAQCVVKIMAGAEIGLPPFQAMQAYHIIEGKPSLAANTIAAKIKASGRYDYRIREWDGRGCHIEFFERGESLGIVAFTEQDARSAELIGRAMWKKYPDAMYFSRCISKGARAHCGDIFGGAIYTPEELGAEVNADGEPLNAMAYAPNHIAIDDKPDGSIRCHCGVQAKYVKGKSGAGWMCGHSGDSEYSACNFRLKDENYKPEPQAEAAPKRLPNAIEARREAAVNNHDPEGESVF